MEKINKYVKKAVRNTKIKRKTGNKPSQISKNRQKCQKRPVENCQKHRKFFKNVKKAEKTSPKYRKIVKNVEKLKKTIKNVEKLSKITKTVKKPTKTSKNRQK